MNRSNSRRHLGFEPLEAMELLSGTGMAAHIAGPQHREAQIHRAHQPPIADVALNLSGTVRGTYHVLGGGAAARFDGQGRVNPVGEAQVKGTINLGLSAGVGQLTLSFGKKGKIFATTTGQATNGGYLYQITGGTRSFAGDTGNGVAVVSILSFHPAQDRGRFSLSLQPPSI